MYLKIVLCFTTPRDIYFYFDVLNALRYPAVKKLF